MKEYTGELQELGPATQKGTWWHYSYVKIGSDIIKNVYIDGKFKVILQDQLIRNGESKLWIIKWFFNPLIIGITQPDGQTFRQSGSRMLWAALFPLIFALPASLFFGAVGAILTLIIFSLIALVPFRLFLKLKSIPADHVF